MKKLKLKRWHKWTIGILSFFILLFLFRFTILRAAGNILIYEDDLKKTETMFILSGGAFDRGTEGAKLFKAGWTKHIVCTGGNQPPDFTVMDSKLLESDLTKIELMKNGVPDSSIELIHEGTSTLEEADIILKYCQQHKLKSVIVLSSKFHTRRIKKYVKKKLERSGIECIVRGSPSQEYDEAHWWKTEDGLLAVNNEWVKLFYYMLK